MELKMMSVIALLLVIFSLQFSLGLGEEVENAAAKAPLRKARQCYYSYYISYCNSYYSNSYYYNYTSSASGVWVNIVSIVSCFLVFCLPCIITGCVLCCCFLIPGCALANSRNAPQTVTSTTVTTFPEEKAPPSYPQANNYPQTTYSQTAYPQTGYPQPVQAANPYPPQGYYPDTAPAQTYPRNKRSLSSMQTETNLTLSTRHTKLTKLRLSTPKYKISHKLKKCDSRHKCSTVHSRLPGHLGDLAKVSRYEGVSLHSV